MELSLDYRAPNAPDGLSNQELAAIALASGCHSFIHLLGPMGITFLVQTTQSLSRALLACTVCLAFGAISVWLSKEAPSNTPERRMLLSLALVGTVAAAAGITALESAGFDGLAAPLVFAALLGGSLGLTSKQQFDMFQTVRHVRGERAHMLVVAGSGLVSGAMVLACIPMAMGPTQALVVFLAASITSWSVYHWLAPKTHCPPYSPATAGDAWKTPPKLLVESAARGVAAAVALFLVLYTGFGQTGKAGLLAASSLGALAVPGILLGYAAQRRTQALEGLAYGTTLRPFVVVMGIVFALVPLIKNHPALICLACFLVMQFNACLTPFNIANLCHSKNLPARVVLPPMYLVNLGCSCLSMGLMALARAWGGETLCFEAAAFMGVVAALSFVPMLPARRNPISVMVLNTLPEDEQPANRAARVKAELLANGLLTAREADVFELLLKNFSRKEIAGRLCISASTVKNHATSVYEKLGVHSQHELVDRILNRGPEER